MHPSFVEIDYLSRMTKKDKDSIRKWFQVNRSTIPTTKYMNTCQLPLAEYFFKKHPIPGYDDITNFSIALRAERLDVYLWFEYKRACTNSQNEEEESKAYNSSLSRYFLELLTMCRNVEKLPSNKQIVSISSTIKVDEVCVHRWFYCEKFRSANCLSKTKNTGKRLPCNFRDLLNNLKKPSSINEIKKLLKYKEIDQAFSIAAQPITGNNQIQRQLIMNNVKNLPLPSLNSEDVTAVFGETPTKSQTGIRHFRSVNNHQLQPQPRYIPNHMSLGQDINISQATYGYGYQQQQQHRKPMSTYLSNLEQTSNSLTNQSIGNYTNLTNKIIGNSKNTTSQNIGSSSNLPIQNIGTNQLQSNLNLTEELHEVIDSLHEEFS